MDREVIDKICTAQGTINAACWLYNMDVAQHAVIKVSTLDDVEAIAEMIYGRDALTHYHVDRSGGWTRAWVVSPEEVEFMYTDYNLDDAYFHVREAKRTDSGWEIAERDVKAVG